MHFAAVDLRSIPFLCCFGAGAPSCIICETWAWSLPSALSEGATRSHHAYLAHHVLHVSTQPLTPEQSVCSLLLSVFTFCPQGCRAFPLPCGVPGVLIKDCRWSMWPFLLVQCFSFTEMNLFRHAVPPAGMPPFDRQFEYSSSTIHSFSLHILPASSAGSDHYLWNVVEHRASRRPVSPVYRYQLVLVLADASRCFHVASLCCGLW